jgi:hypothetical protein
VGIVAVVLAFTVIAIGAASVLNMGHTQDCFPASECKQLRFGPFDGFCESLDISSRAPAISSASLDFD